MIRFMSPRLLPHDKERRKTRRGARPFIPRRDAWLLKRWFRVEFRHGAVLFCGNYRSAPSGNPGQTPTTSPSGTAHDHSERSALHHGDPAVHHIKTAVRPAPIQLIGADCAFRNQLLMFRLLISCGKVVEACRTSASVAAQSRLVEAHPRSALVVFLREVALDELRRDHHRQIGGLVADLLDRSLGLEMNLAFGVLTIVSASALGLLTHLFPQPFGIRRASAAMIASASRAPPEAFRCIPSGWLRPPLSAAWRR